MEKHKQPFRYGYCYLKTDTPRHDAAARDDDQPSRLRFRLFGIHWRALPLYRRAGKPFGDSDLGMLLWLEFGCRGHSN